MALGMASSYLPLWQWQVLGYLSSGHSGSVWLGQVFGGLLLWAAPPVWSGWVLGCVSYDLPLEGIYIMSIHKNVGSDPLMYTYIQRRRCTLAGRYTTLGSASLGANDLISGSSFG